MKKFSMSFLKHLILTSTLCVLALPLVTSAETVVRTGESVSIKSDQVVENDFYAAAGTVSMSGMVTGDMHAAAGTVTVNGSIGQDLTLLAGSAQIHASTSDDVRVLGGETVIAKDVGGDVFVIGGLLKILSTARVHGDVIFYGGELEISGPVDGSVVGAAEAVRIDAAVGGDVDVKGSRAVVLGDRANVSGNLIYTSNSEATRAQNAVVEGEIVRESTASIGDSFNIEDLLIPVFILLFTNLSLYLIFRKELQHLMNQITDSPSRAGLIGVGILLGGVVVAVLLMVTVLGFLLGLMTLFAWLLLCAGALALTGILTGVLLAQAFNQGRDITLLWVVLGTILVFVLSGIPIIGSLAVFALFVVVLGGLGHAIYRMLT